MSNRPTITVLLVACLLTSSAASFWTIIFMAKRGASVDLLLLRLPTYQIRLCRRWWSDGRSPKWVRWTMPLATAAAWASLAALIALFVL